MASGTIKSITNSILVPEQIAVTSNTVTIADQQVYLLGKFVIGSIRFTLDSSINSGNTFIGGLPRVETTLSEGTSCVACASNKDIRICNGSSSASLLAGETLASGTYVASFSYLSE